MLIHAIPQHPIQQRVNDTLVARAKCLAELIAVHAVLVVEHTEAGTMLDGRWQMIDGREQIRGQIDC